MNAPDTPPLVDRERARAVLRALRAVLGWELPDEGWQEVGQLVADLAEAVRTSDTDLVDELTADLETGGWRVTRLGAADDDRVTSGKRKAPTPAPVRERVVTLIHVLDTTSDRNGGPAGGPTAGPGRR
ncbi:hypothetical protein HY68_11450 [Streptomyces sp. AcH 505]|uniref:CATRA system-associated protein n=1 Tax=Streptomyces sp. AcH 505 TaxID=352211 RepID=UPI0005919915|nr:hypothetical protein HY68_11450 [Streptomyces sp. AcH 505]